MDLHKVLLVPGAGSMRAAAGPCTVCRTGTAEFPRWGGKLLPGGQHSGLGFARVNAALWPNSKTTRLWWMGAHCLGGCKTARGWQAAAMGGAGNSGAQPREAARDVLLSFTGNQSEGDFQNQSRGGKGRMVVFPLETSLSQNCFVSENVMPCAIPDQL